MTTLVNKYFKKGVSTEQTLIQGLIDESIQVNGNTFYYLPRKLQKLDFVFGEDVLSKFDVTLPIEMYMENVTGFENQQELLSKFGLEIRKNVTLVVSRVRWATEVKKIASSMWESSRPQEGDLVWDPSSKMIFEIKFVDQDAIFLQGNKYYTFTLKCEMFQFNNEDFNTGITAIDNISSGNLFEWQIKLSETGTDLLLQEDGSSLFLDVISDELYDTSLNLNKEADLLEFDVKNPFINM
jgi:hypothetical protein